MQSHIITPHASPVGAIAENTSLFHDPITDNIYAAYIQSDLIPVIAQAHISAPHLWSHHALSSTPVVNDSHNGISLGVDASGLIHASWNMHGAHTLIYSRSSSPHDITTMVPITIPASDLSLSPLDFQPDPSLPTLSYPRFYCAGPYLYLLFRNGDVGQGDQYMMVWSAPLSRWMPIQSPLGWFGADALIPFSPYLGTCHPTSTGHLHVVWTNRTSHPSAPYYNYGVYHALFDPTTREWLSVGGTKSESSSTPSDYMVYPDLTDGSISNTGFGVIEDHLGRPHIGFMKRHPSGHQELYHATFDPLSDLPGSWVISQVTDTRLLRLRGCPTGPMTGPYRPCDMELQGPWMGLTEDGSLCLFYGRSVSLPGLAWQRPATILYRALSHDLGQTWDHSEVKLPISQLTSEVTRGQGGPSPGVWELALCHDLVQGAGGDVPLRLWDFREDPIITSPSISTPPPVVSVTAHLSPLAAPYLIVPVTPTFSLTGGLSVLARLRPAADISAPQCVVDMGGAFGVRSFRVCLWAGGPPHAGSFAYDPTRVQVLIGGSDGDWGLRWYPQIVSPIPSILPREVARLWVTWDHQTVTLYLNGVVVASTSCTGSPVVQSGDMVVGGLRSASGVVVYPFRGELAVKVWERGLTREEMEYWDGVMG